MPAPSPGIVSLVRQRYVEGASLEAIKAETGIRDTTTLYACLDGEYDDGSGERPKPLPRRRIVLRRVRPTRRGSRKSITRRLWLAAERQVREIEERLTTAHQEPAERERDARVLAILVKTLRELSAFDGGDNGTARPQSKDAHDDFPRDVDELRRELSRRLDSLAAENPD